MYEWIKALHIIAVIAWMAGMLYLPRLFVYHVGSVSGSAQSETFKIMERRLLKAIMTPSMLIVWVLGIWLLLWNGADSAFLREGWMHSKLLLVLIMTGIHGWFAGMVRAFANDRNTKTGGFFRVINEVPTVLMIVIVILVVVKPF